MDDKLLLAKTWFIKAENDLRNAELVLDADTNDIPYDTVCFHSQQVAEKYLKGLLVILDIDFPKTHNIEVLLDLLEPHIPEIENYGHAVELTPYAVESRYPDDFVPVYEQEARDSLRIAQGIKALVLKMVVMLHPDWETLVNGVNVGSLLMMNNNPLSG